MFTVKQREITGLPNSRTERKRSVNATPNRIQPRTEPAWVASRTAGLPWAPGAPGRRQPPKCAEHAVSTLITEMQKSAHLLKCACHDLALKGEPTKTLCLSWERPEASALRDKWQREARDPAPAQSWPGVLSQCSQLGERRKTVLSMVNALHLTIPTVKRKTFRNSKSLGQWLDTKIKYQET